MKKTVGTLLVLSLILLFISCDDLKSDDWGEEGIILSAGFNDCWYIAANDSTTYEPLNMDDSYRIDSLKIRFEYEVEEEMGSYCMIGKYMVTLIRIEKF